MMKWMTFHFQAKSIFSGNVIKKHHCLRYLTKINYYKFLGIPHPQTTTLNLGKGPNHPCVPLLSHTTATMMEVKK